VKPYPLPRPQAVRGWPARMLALAAALLFGFGVVAAVPSATVALSPPLYQRRSIFYLAVAVALPSYPLPRHRDNNDADRGGARHPDRAAEARGAEDRGEISHTLFPFLQP
jgi:hypothetical protein